MHDILKLPEEPRLQMRQNVSPTNSKVPSVSDMLKEASLSESVIALSSAPDRS